MSSDSTADVIVEASLMTIAIEQPNNREVGEVCVSTLHLHLQELFVAKYICTAGRAWLYLLTR